MHSALALGLVLLAARHGALFRPLAGSHGRVGRRLRRGAVGGGLALSLLADTPAGPSIVATGAGMFAVTAVMRRRRVN